MGICDENDAVRESSYLIAITLVGAIEKAEGGKAVCDVRQSYAKAHSPRMKESLGGRFVKKCQNTPQLAGGMNDRGYEGTDSPYPYSSAVGSFT